MIDKPGLKLKIEEEITKAQQQIDELKIQTQPISPENAIGRISRMDAINNKSVAEASLRNLQDKLTKLATALSKLDNPDFGICVRCKQPIAAGRLMLMPESNRCINCA